MNDERLIISDEALADILRTAVDAELDKPENEQDLDFVARCVEIINHINGTAAELTGEEIEGIIKEISAKADLRSVENTGKTKRVRFGIIKRVLAAACIVLLILITPIAAIAAIESRSPVDILKVFGMTIFDLPYDEPVEVNGITFQRISPDNISLYNDIESLILDEGLDILYPSWLPEGVKITSLVKNIVDGEDWISFRFSENKVSFSIMQSAADDPVKSGSFDPEEAEILYYRSDGNYHAQFLFNGYSYNIGAETQIILEEIIKGIKAPET